MVFINAILKPIQDVCKTFKENKGRKEAPSDAEWDEWLKVCDDKFDLINLNLSGI